MKEPTTDKSSRGPSWPDSDSSGAPPGGYSSFLSSQILRGSSVRCVKEPTTDKSSRGPSWPGSDSSGAPPGGYSAYHSSQILRGSSVRCVKEPTFDTTSRRPSWPDSDSSGAPPGGYSAYRSSQILRGSSVRCVKEPTSDTTSRGSSWPVSHKGNISLYLVLCITSQILCGDYVTNMKVTNAYHDKFRALLWRMGHYLIALVWAYVLYTINSNDCNGRQMGNSSSQQPVCGNLNRCTSAPQCASRTSHNGCTTQSAQHSPLLHVRGHPRALPSGGAFGFMLWKVGEALLRAVQRRLHYHDRGH